MIYGLCHRKLIADKLILLKYLPLIKSRSIGEFFYLPYIRFDRWQIYPQDIRRRSTSLNTPKLPNNTKTLKIRNVDTLKISLLDRRLNSQVWEPFFGR